MIGLAHYFKGDGLKAQFFRGVSGAAFLHAINLPLVLISGVLLARNMGPGNYGVYTFVLGLITLLGLPAKAGLPTLLVRETAKNKASESWGLMKGLLQASHFFVLFYSAAVILLVGGMTPLLWSGDIAGMEVFLWGLCLLPILALEGIRTAALRGLQWIVSSQLAEQIIRPVVMIGLTCSVLLLGKQLTAVAAVKLQITAAVVAFLFGSFVLLRALPKQSKNMPAQYSIKVWLWSLLPLSLFSGLRMLDSQLSILLLGILGGAEDVGLFRVAITGAALVAFGLTAINLALAPQIVRLYQAGDTRRLQRLITLTTRAALLISIPVATIFFVWGDKLIQFVFGGEYMAASPALTILCVGQLINVSCGSVILVLNMTGNDRSTVAGALIALVVNVLLCLILVPLYGLIGAAVAYTVSLATWNAMLVCATRKKTGVRTFFI